MSMRSMARRLTLTAVAATVALGAGGAAQAAPSFDKPLPKWPRPTVQDGATMQAEEPSVGPQLTAGQTMGEDRIMKSPSGQHVVTINGYLGEQYGLVLTGYTGDPLPLSRTGAGESSKVDNKLAMQSDGNLVLYTDGRPTWWTGTAGNPGAKVAIQDDRNLVVYSSSGKVLWFSNTVMESATSYFLDASNNESGFIDPRWYLQSADRRYAMYMQTDGNMVLYSPAGRALWQSGTGGNPGAYAVMQHDGNLVIYAAGGSRPLWWSGTGRGAVGASHLVVQRDGNVVMYFTGPNGQQARWATNTNGRV